MDSPSGRVPERAPKRFLMAIEACGSGTPDLGYVSGDSGFIGGFGIENKLGGPTGLLSDNFLFQYILYFPEKISIDFQRIPRTFISAQKQHHGSSAENSVSPG